MGEILGIGSELLTNRAMGMGIATAVSISAITLTSQAAKAVDLPAVQYTSIGAPGWVDELSHAQVFSSLYGGTFVATTDGTPSLTNGAMTALRIPDYVAGSGPLNILDPATLADDAIWYNGALDASAEAVFALYMQSFGVSAYNTQPSSAFTAAVADTGDLIAVSGQKLNATSSTLVTDMTDMTFTWIRGGDNGVFSSNPADNRDGKDHMVTYLLQNNEPAVSLLDVQGSQQANFTYVLFWEDSTATGNVAPGRPGDFDYQDLVVVVNASYSTVPEPASVGLVGALGGLGLLKRRRSL